jgi:hypothetical protein
MDNGAMTQALVLVLSIFLDSAFAAEICLDTDAPAYCVRSLAPHSCPQGKSLYHKESCVVPNETLDTALGKERNSVIPDSLYETYSDSEIAAALIRRMRDSEIQQERLANPIRTNLDLYAETEILMAMPYKYVGSAAENGFLNFHQIGHTEGNVEGDGFDDSEERKGTQRSQIEDLMVGIRLEERYLRSPYIKKINSLRPKYAFLQFNRPSQADLLPNSIYSQYGGVFFVFKDHVKRRSTFTENDSLCTRCLEDQKPIGNRTFYSDFSKAVFDRRGRKGPGNFFESQIWGKLTFNDVSHVLVNCRKTPRQLPFEQIDWWSIQKLKYVYGLPVFQCEPKIDPATGYNFRLNRGAKL